jgi:hypothetical protein
VVMNTTTSHTSPRRPSTALQTKTANNTQAPAMASRPQEKATDCAICDEHFDSLSALAHHTRNSAEHAKKLQHKLAMLRRTFECESCFRCFGSAEALTEHKIDSERLAAERSQAPGNEFDEQTLKALTELKRESERLAAERAQQVASDNELSLQTLSLQPPTDDSPWSTYPDLHESVLQCLEGNGLSITFYEEGEAEDSIRDYDTNIMGAFICPNRSCRTEKWTSKKVAISIRLFADQQYNATVWHQRCRQCKSMGVLRLDKESYTERVVYRLHRWFGLETEDPIFSGGIRGHPPHVTELCEGCKSGHCPEWVESSRHGVLRGGRVTGA